MFEESENKLMATTYMHEKKKKKRNSRRAEIVQKQCSISSNPHKRNSILKNPLEVAKHQLF